MVRDLKPGKSHNSFSMSQPHNTQEKKKKKKKVLTSKKDGEVERPRIKQSQGT